MSKKRFVKIIVAIGVVVIIGIASYFTFYFITQKGCISPFYTGTDLNNNSFVIESKKILINLGVGEDYFNDHFQLLSCVANKTTGSINVEWLYKIGEFAVIIEDSFSFNDMKENRAHNINTEIQRLSEIKTVISKDEANQRMQACIGEFEKAWIGFVLANEIDSQLYNKNPLSRLSLVAYSVKKESKLGYENMPYKQQWMQGFIDLETGKCSKRRQSTPDASIMF